jgi:hypothetical protein
MNLVERVKAILLDPKSEWKAIEGEPGSAGYLFPNYVAIVAAIPPVCAFIRGVMIGYGPFHIGLFSGLLHAIFTYVLTFVGVYVMAFILDFLAGTFGGQKNFDNAMRVSVYAPTAAWLAGVFNLVPFLSILGLVGLYSLYLLHTGIAVLMRPPADKALIYTIAAVVCVIVIWIVIVSVPAMIFGMSMMR